MSNVQFVDFPSTHWTLVDAACSGAPGDARSALGILLKPYMAPLSAYVRREWGFGEWDADDLVQSFVTDRIIAGDLVARADQRRGRFRDLLRSAVDTDVLQEFRKNRRKKRGGGAVGSIELVPEQADRRQAASSMFDIEWARAVLAAAADRMQRRCEATGRAELWSLFDGRVFGPTMHGRDVVPYDELIRRFGFENPEKASNALMTAKRMYARALRAVVGEYALGEAAIEEEIADLHRILANR